MGQEIKKDSSWTALTLEDGTDRLSQKSVTTSEWVKKSKKILLGLLNALRWDRQVVPKVGNYQ